MRVAVIGLGGVGTAAARFLAAAGHEVVGFEQFRLDHDRGSSYGGSRIIRRVYPDPLYASLMFAAYPLWEELERESRESLLLRTGGFFFGAEDSADMGATEAALEQVGVPYRRLSRTEAAARFPQFRLSEGEYGLWEPDSGLLRASRCVLANARGARALGAELREEMRIEGLDLDGAQIRITVDGQEEAFDRVVVTAGPWLGKLLAEHIDLPLTPTRQHYAHFAPQGDPAAFAPDRFPVWIDFDALCYGFPIHDDIPGAKVALHIPGAPWDPDASDRQPNTADEERLRAYIRRRLPDLDGPVTYSKICLYTMTPDEDFILDRLPSDPRVTLVGGLSGHGFKFTALLGQIAAHLATGGDPGHDISRFRISRFRG